MGQLVKVLPNSISTFTNRLKFVAVNLVSMTIAVDSLGLFRGPVAGENAG